MYTHSTFIHLLHLYIYTIYTYDKQLASRSRYQTHRVTEFSDFTLHGISGNEMEYQEMNFERSFSNFNQGPIKINVFFSLVSNF